MRSKPLISIIVPIYNVESYLEKCIESILQQNYKNIELLLIDDGSLDRSGAICDFYAKQDSRIMVCHKTHGGVSSARNMGLSLAKGSWIGFVDADDYIDHMMYECMIEKARLKHAELVVCRFFKGNDDCMRPMKNVNRIDDDCFSGRKAIEYGLMREQYRSFCSYVWNKLFHRSKIDGMFFDEKIFVCEDVDFFMRVAERCEKVYFVDKPLYFHLERQNSAWTGYQYEKRITALSAYEKTINLLESKGMKDAILHAIRFYAYHASLIMELAVQNHDVDKYEEIKSYMKRYYAEYCYMSRDNISYIERYNQLLNYEE